MKRPLLKFFTAAALVALCLHEGGAKAETNPLYETWLKPQAPFNLYGNSYYVGTAGLSSILIVSPGGHVLIDGTLAETAPQIAANIAALGFRIEDVKIILNTHSHFDHAAGTAELQKLSGATVWASPASAKVLESGEAGPDDPQYGIKGYTPAHDVKVLHDNQLLKVGSAAVTAHFTPGHTPGGTTWTWDSCEQERCLHMVYTDSLNPVSAPNFRFSQAANYPNVLTDFRRSYAVLESLDCDILVSVHPEQSNLWQRLEKRAAGDKDALVDATACRRYAQNAREALVQRLSKEKDSH